MTIKQKFGTFLLKKRNKIFPKINKFKQLRLSKNWHLFCLLLKRICILNLNLSFGFTLQNVKFGIFHERIIN